MAHLLSHILHSSTKVQNLIDQLVKEVQASSQKITNIQSPDDPQNQKQNSHLVEQIFKVRGQAMAFPGVGSGLGHGCFMEFEDGSIKLDFIGAMGVHILGHSHPEIIRTTLKASLSDVVLQGNVQLNKEYEALSQKMVQIASRNSRLRYCWLCPSGSMSNENALKMARQKNNPAHKVIAMRRAFAGRTTLMAAITDNEHYKMGLPRYDEIFRVSFPRNAQEAQTALSELENILKAHKQEIAAFMFEPVQGEGGFWTTQKEYIEPLLKLCQKNKIAVWLDEVQTFARTGEFFCFENLGIGNYVDLCTVGKALQSGGVLYTEEYKPGPGLVAGTFAGSTAALSAGLTVLNFLEKNNYIGPGGKIEKIHKKCIQVINDLAQGSCKGLISEIGGSGLMISFTPFKGEEDKVIELNKRCFNNGLVVFRCGRGPFRMRLLLPAIVSEEQIELAGEIIEKSLLEMTSS